jgi:hypothetical protein
LPIKHPDPVCKIAGRSIQRRAKKPTTDQNQIAAVLLKIHPPILPKLTLAECGTAVPHVTGNSNNSSFYQKKYAKEGEAFCFDRQADCPRSEGFIPQILWRLHGKYGQLLTIIAVTNKNPTAKEAEIPKC